MRGAALDAVGGTERALGRFPILLYYSLVTLTTLGYGDVTPVHPISRSLATAEAMMGQLYLAVLVGPAVRRT